jgi:hypothetical protein
LLFNITGEFANTNNGDVVVALFRFNVVLFGVGVVDSNDGTTGRPIMDGDEGTGPRPIMDGEDTLERLTLTLTLGRQGRWRSHWLVRSGANWAVQSAVSMFKNPLGDWAWFNTVLAFSMLV